MKKSESEREKGNFKYTRLSWFLTYPRTSCSKEDFVASLPFLKTSIPVQWGYVAQEKHEDGTPHLHALLRFRTALTVRDSAFFDVLTRTHGNYQPCKNVKACIKYLHKEDANPLKIGDPPSPGEDAPPEKKASVTREIAEMAMQGKSFKDICEISPGFALLHMKSIQAFKAYWEDLRLSKPKEPFKRLWFNGTHLPTVRVVDWVNLNFLYPRHHKQPQLYVYGPPNSFKTTFAHMLSRWFRPYVLAQEDWYEGYEDDKYDYAIIDEFKGEAQGLSALNQFLEGSECRLKIKGSSVVKRKNIPIIILSNFSVKTNLMAPSVHEPLLARLEVVEIPPGQSIQTALIYNSDQKIDLYGN